MCKELQKHIGEEITIGMKRPDGRAFFYSGELIDVSATHLFLFTAGKTQGFLLTDVSKIEFQSKGGASQ